MRSRRERSASQPERLATYLDRLSQVAGHADRIVPMQNYTKGLFLPIERKSVEPMAAWLAPANVRQMHQSLHHIVAEAAWSDAVWLREVRRCLEPEVGRPQCCQHGGGVSAHRQHCFSRQAADA